MISLAFAFAAFAQLAQAAECDANFGEHAIPPVPIWSPLVDDLPYGRFQWGADAYSDLSGQWWRTSVVRNADAALVIGWYKAGIFFDARRPLSPGAKHCKHGMLSFGPRSVPVLDPDAPILYGGSRRQEAAVYVQNIQANGALPAGAPSSSGVGQKRASAITRVQTSYRDDKGTELPALIQLRTIGDSGKFALFFEKNQQEIIIGITALANILDSERVESMRRALESQGFNIEVAPTLGNFIGPDAVKSLFWSDDKSAPDGRVIFIGGGTKGPKGQFNFEYSSEILSERQSAMIVILDKNKHAIAADRIDLIVPQTNR